MEAASDAIGCDSRLDIVKASRRHVDGVFQPFPSFHVADVIAATDIRRGFDVNGSGTVLSAVVRAIGIVVGNSLTAVVKVLSLNRGRKIKWRTQIGTLNLRRVV